ncbi:MAG: hypothetical protein FIA90_13945 [candidate division NC10 bacterium]|nr:hypothetical protein [candidate division NC10 bacterium]
MSVHPLDLVRRNVADNARRFSVKPSVLPMTTTTLHRSARRHTLNERPAMTPLRMLLALGTLLLAGCAPALTPLERTSMLERYAAWAPDIAFYAPIAQAAYRNSSRIPTLPNTVFVRVTDVPVAGSVPGTTTAYLLGTDNAAHRHYIGIEGTQDFRQLLTDADAVPKQESALAIPVHPGFAAVARAVDEDLKAKQLLKPGYTVGLTGHSLGGAAALLLAMRIEKAGGAVERLVTFGQPKVTDTAGGSAFNRLMQKTTRVVSCDDVVAFLPSRGYAHGGDVLLLLDSPHFEAAREDLSRRLFAIALLGNLKDVRDDEIFRGHHMNTYITRLAQPRTKPQIYTTIDPKLCDGH